MVTWASHLLEWTRVSSAMATSDPHQWTSVEQPPSRPQQQRRTLTPHFPLHHLRCIRDKALALLLLRQHKNDVRLWQALDPALQRDHEVAVAALEGGALPEVTDLPDALRQDRDFWLALIRSDASRWCNQLPEDLIAEIDFVGSIISCLTHEQHVRILLIRFPELQSNAHVWLKVVHCGLASVDLLADLASPGILQDKTVLLEACQKDYKVYDVLCAPLNRDRDLVAASLRSSPAALYDIPAFVQRMYPELVADAIQRSPHNADWLEYVGEELWSHRQVALAWACIGGDYLNEQFPAHFRHDKLLFLLIAEHNWSAFGESSSRLRSDKPYMMQAVEKNGIVLHDAVGNLRQDFDLALTAFYNTNDLLDSYDDHNLEDDQFINDFRRHLAANLQEHANFQLVLGGMSLGPDEGCSLGVLNQGHETSVIYKRLLAEYTGVAVGSELGRLRTAFRNVSRWNVE